MTVSVKTSGSQTATISTEHDLATISSDPGVYQLVVDLANLADGTTPDIVELRTYGKARSSDTERLMEVWSFVGAQGKPLFRSNPEINPHYNRYTLKQTQGTGRAFPWAIYTV